MEESVDGFGIVDPRNPQDRQPVVVTQSQLTMFTAAGPGKYHGPFGQPPEAEESDLQEDRQRSLRRPERRRNYTTSEAAIAVRELWTKFGPGELHMITLEDVPALEFPQGWTISADKACGLARDAGVPLVIMDSDCDPSIPMVLVVSTELLLGYCVEHRVDAVMIPGPGLRAKLRSLRRMRATFAWMRLRRRWRWPWHSR